MPLQVLALTAALGVVLAFGRYLPGLDEVVGWAEGLAAFRYPVKLLFIPALLVPILAGAGLMVVRGLATPGRRAIGRSAL